MSSYSTGCDFVWNNATLGKEGNQYENYQKEMVVSEYFMFCCVMQRL